MSAKPSELLKKLIALDEERKIIGKPLTADPEFVAIIHEAKELFLTPTEKRVLGAILNHGEWVGARTLRCQERIACSLVDEGLVEKNWPRGGPYEYRAVKNM